MLQRYAVAAAHILHLAALVAAQARKLGAHVARRQVGDDAVAHAGARVVERRQVELLRRNSSSTATPGTMISARRGPMPVTLRRRRQAQLRNPARRVSAPAAVETRSRSISSRLERGTRATALATADAVAEVAITRSHPVWPSRRTAAVQLRLDVLLHLVQLPRRPADRP